MQKMITNPAELFPREQVAEQIVKFLAHEHGMYPDSTQRGEDWVLIHYID